jgi:hypothetical protein
MHILNRAPALATEYWAVTMFTFPSIRQSGGFFDSIDAVLWRKSGNVPLYPRDQRDAAGYS